MEWHTKIEKKSEIHSEIEFQNKEHVPFPFEFRKLIAVGLFELSPSLSHSLTLNINIIPGDLVECLNSISDR